MVHGLSQAVFRNQNSGSLAVLDLSSFSYVLKQVSDITLHEKKKDYLCNCKPEIGNVCIPVEDHCLRAMKIVHHHTNSRFDWLGSGHQGVNPAREVISILSGKYKRFTFVHPV